MIRFIMPLIILGISISIFFVFINPMYNEISQMRGEVAAYNEALSNSKALENERDKLTAKYNSINPDDLARLQKLLPENIDNIRLILEIEQIALPYGMVLRDVEYSPTPDPNAVTAPGAPGNIQGGTPVSVSRNENYGTWDLEFSTTGTYNNFLNFTRDLESNLRVVDISSIQFSSDDSSTSGTDSSPSQSYKYDFRIKTYWLKK